MTNPIANHDAGKYVGEDFVPDEIPEMLKDDSLIAYFRRRFNVRDTYLEDLKDNERQRVQTELDRIEISRKEYAERNSDRIKVLEYRRTLWKQHAFSEKANSLETLPKRLAKMVKMFNAKPTNPNNGISNYQHREELERYILKEVGKWKIDDPEVPLSLEASAAVKETYPKRRLSIFGSRKNDKTSECHSQLPVTGREKKEDNQNASYRMHVRRITMTNSSADIPSYTNPKLDSYPLEVILNETDKSKNPLMEPCDANMIRYYHFPANNMEWVEEAIARYYGEIRGELNYREHKDYREFASNLLNRKYWTSLQHGNVQDPIHARHMRSHCSLITPENKPGTKNFVIFMPYLHWETHDRQQIMAKVINEETREQRLRNPPPIVLERTKTALRKIVEETRSKLARQLTGLSPLEKPKSNSMTAENEPKPERTKLGEYLLEVAKVYSAMEIEADVRLLRDNLHRKPPLHPRRTLDQSYYWKLQDTSVRDQDQVVYRETKSGINVLRTSRVIMVDQLWLYILDDHTIISFFPKRWGRNKPDWSGVHKSIRTRLTDKNLRPNEIQSIYDLAMIIMDQCSTVFFDRSKPVDERPELLDIFSNALSHVSALKSTAFETFWRHLDRISRSSLKEPDFEVTARKYLNINPEGQLLRDAHDIFDELRMMIQIFEEQSRISETFSKHLEDLTSKGSEKESASDGTLQVLVDIRNVLEKNYAKRSKIVEVNNGSTEKSKSSESQKSSTVSRPIPDKTLHHARDLIHNISQRQFELQRFEARTMHVCDQINNLLDLKQQQASIIEAKSALQRADETINQGRSIMLFTIITIIFLPLSFMTSVFGMNATEFSTPSGGNSMSLREQFKYLFPISLGVIVISLSLAFIPWLRDGIFWLLEMTWTIFTKYTGLQYIWLNVINYSGKDRRELRRQVEKAKRIEHDQEMRSSTLECRPKYAGSQPTIVGERREEFRQSWTKERWSQEEFV